MTFNALFPILSTTLNLEALRKKAQKLKNVIKEPLKNSLPGHALRKDAVHFGSAQNVRSCLDDFVDYIPADKIASDTLFSEHAPRAIFQRFLK